MSLLRVSQNKFYFKRATIHRCNGFEINVSFFHKINTVLLHQSNQKDVLLSVFFVFNQNNRQISFFKCNYRFNICFSSIMSSESAEIFTWMNGDYFKSILAKYEGHDNDVELIEFSVKSGSVKGENFASAIYRAKLSYLLNQQPKEASFIIKTTSASSAISELLENMGTFDHETHIYQKVLTECEKLFPDTKLSPRYAMNFNRIPFNFLTDKKLFKIQKITLR